MATSISAPHQANQTSRKGKKAWRKNVDISEIQQGLETAREEQLQGGLLAELPSASLFKIESSGDSSIQKAYNKEHKPLRADQILAQRSAIPALDVRKRKASSSGVGDGIIPAKRRKDVVSRKDLERLRGIAYGGDAVKKDVVTVNGKVQADIWGDDGSILQAPGISAEEKYSFLEDAQDIRAPETLKHKPLSLLANGKALPAVPKPVEGKSYNPNFEAWEALLEREGNAEVVRERQRLDAAARDAELQLRVAQSALEAQQAEETAEESAWESEWEGFLSEKEAESGAEGGDVKASRDGKRAERKTKAERNRIARRKEEERKRMHEGKMAERDRQIMRSKELAKLEDQRRQDRAAGLAVQPYASSDSDDDDNGAFDAAQVLRRRRLGKMAVPERPLEVVLADELRDSLRALRPEGNLLSERFRSLQVRGKIEARRPVWQSKKARRKATEKWSYKDWKLKV